MFISFCIHSTLLVFVVNSGVFFSFIIRRMQNSSLPFNFPAYRLV